MSEESDADRKARHEDLMRRSLVAEKMRKDGLRAGSWDLALRDCTDKASVLALVMRLGGAEALPKIGPKRAQLIHEWCGYTRAPLPTIDPRDERIRALEGILGESVDCMEHGQPPEGGRTHKLCERAKVLLAEKLKSGEKTE